MKYFPLEVIDELEQGDVLNSLLDTFSKSLSSDIGKEIELTDEFAEFVLTDDFFDPNYTGKWEDVNNYLLYNKELNDMLLNGVKFTDWHQRRTEWRDFFGEYLVLNRWRKSKIVYKIDNEFFHEVKNTGNLKISKPMFEHLPVYTMYFDLYDVENIGDFKGAWVDINRKGDDFLFSAYMVTDGSISKVQTHAFFSYYCGFRFFNNEEMEMDLKEALHDVTDTFHINDYRTFDMNTGAVIRQPLDKSDDHRAEIVTAILQILQFLHADIEDIMENNITKSTYRPSATIKNKFSEIRMWDVGVRYGKAIKFAKKQVEQAMKEENEDISDSKERKTRKPVRPHIRSAHWQRYHVGEGRKQIKINWIPPVYVCGGREIAVTIHKVG